MSEINTGICIGFNVKINCHTRDIFKRLRDPETVRFLLGQALERSHDPGLLLEEVDFTLEVSRIYDDTLTGTEVKP